MTGHGLARTLSKWGYCSRSEAFKLIRSGRVTVDGRVVSDPEYRIGAPAPKVAVDGQSIAPFQRIYLMLNKPRGLVTTASDEKGRETVFDCFRAASLPHLSPVGRLDQASEGLLLFTNDTEWANRITAPESRLTKTYHVQVDRRVDEPFLDAMRNGVAVEGTVLAVRQVQVLREGEKNCWLEIVLDEGKNRQIRRILEALDTEVLRLIRISIGSLALGNLAKGEWRHLSQEEVVQVAGS
ncbi:MAG TPA: pseudouridine synthase [Candidatus Limnocylindria bacterium]|jgi:23S rRNA pseudouridine2605 synthase|nr:pseudouridine synthase [Candidatus Limnocylindria bacterium]